MHITILAIGTRGDVLPYIALGLGLQAAGNQVRIGTHTSFETIVRSNGLEFAPLASDPSTTIKSNTGRSWRESYDNGLFYVYGLQKLAAHIMRERLESCRQACQGTQMIIASGLALLAGYHIAEKLKLTLIPALTAPLTPTRAYPSSFVPASLKLGGRFNLLTHRLILQLLWSLLRAQANAARKEVLNLPPLPRHEPFTNPQDKCTPVLYGYSPSFAPAPADWGNWLHVTGYWFLKQPQTWQPPPALLNFLAAGPPPVCVGFGSMANQNSAEIAELVVKALTQAEMRGVLLTGWGGLSMPRHTDTIYILESAPHEWLFPQMALVIHHGGAGTVAAGLCSGAPMIMIPFLPDHHFWARRAYELGVGPQPITRRQLSAKRLADAIQTTVCDAGMKQRAIALGRRIRAEDGVTNAVNVIHNYLAGHRHTHPVGQEALS